MPRAAQDYRRFLQPEVVSKLASMDLRARLVVEGFIAGLHRSPYHGFSVEFAEYRQYMPGDEVKHIDWKVYGRTDRFYVKEFEEETNLKCYLLLDASGSMGYASGPLTKLQYASYLAAALTYLMLQQRDAVGLVTFDQKIRTFVPPRSVSSYLHVILRQLDRMRSRSRTNVAATLHELAERIKRRGLIILFSDLFDEPSEVLAGLQHFRHRKHEVIVFHILDPLERTFSFRQDGLFKDLETDETISTQPWHIRGEYRALVEQFLDTYRRGCRQHRIDYVLMDTAASYDRALLQYLLKRQRVGG
ncbi:MAG: DUF58 domain-containing protein [bacterium]|nr:DUF58 domain-containing protein [candidate division KSB1 bacterium]MDH7559095.1 DUF58 domain-containing protein [bacterium]